MTPPTITCAAAKSAGVFPGEAVQIRTTSRSVRAT